MVQKEPEGMQPKVLGHVVACPDDYSPGILESIPRDMGRSRLDPPLLVGQTLPFHGTDVWNCYEVSWLRGGPRHGYLELTVACNTPCLVESKSLKLYLNSLNFKTFDSDAAMLQTVVSDLTPILQAKAEDVKVRLLTEEPPLINSEEWVSVDDEEFGDSSDPYSVDEGLLSMDQAAGDGEVCEKLVCHLLRTNCPVTNQPDWGSILVHYEGRKMCRAGLKRYLCSLRREVGFHEVCVEKIFIAIQRRLNTSKLEVTGRFMRRGGIDINPFRTSHPGWGDGGGKGQLRILGQ